MAFHKANYGPAHMTLVVVGYLDMTSIQTELSTSFAGWRGGSAIVRDNKGLTYGVGASLANDMFNDGDWRVSASFAPELLEKGLASTRHQLDLWHRDGVTPAEIEARKSNLIGSFKVNLSATWHV